MEGCVARRTVRAGVDRDLHDVAVMGDPLLDRLPVVHRLDRDVQHQLGGCVGQVAWLIWPMPVS